MMVTHLRTAATGLAALVLLSAAACSSNSATAPAGSGGNASTAAQQSTTSQQPVQQTRVQNGKELSAADVVQLAEPSIARVSTTTAQGTGVGTGFVVDPAGYIITNNHVVDGARARTGSGTGITVTMTDGAQFEAKVVGTDLRSDLALLKIDATNLKALTLGDLENVVVGQDVLAIGYALDLQGSDTVTRGIVSAKNRSIDENQPVLGAIQTDAAINHGNSGGPLLDMTGVVIGVNTAIAPDSTTGGVAPGIGFAVGANTVKAVYEQLKTNGKVDRGYLGIRNFQALRPAKAKELGIPDGTQGVFLPAAQQVTTSRGTQTVSSVATGDPADKAGIKPGDVLTKIADTPVADESELAVALIKHHAGEKVTIELYRSGKKMTVDATLGAPPTQ